MTDNERSESEIRGRWDEFTTAITQGDAVALGYLLTADFTLGHMTGHREPREEWLAKIAAGEDVYHSVQNVDVTVDFRDVDAPIVVARTDTDLTMGGERGQWQTRFDTRFVRHGDTWIATSTDGSAW